MTRFSGVVDLRVSIFIAIFFCSEPGALYWQRTEHNISRSEDSNIAVVERQRPLPIQLFEKRSQGRASARMSTQNEIRSKYHLSTISVDQLPTTKQ